MQPCKLIVGSVLSAFVWTAQPAAAVGSRDGGPSGAFTFSTETRVASLQAEAKAVVDRYQTGLNSSDFSKIRPLFAPDAVAEWNGKATVNGVDAMEQPYQALFKVAKFDTEFQYDAVDVYGDMAIVRTHHPVGQTELSLVTGKKSLDFNREIFVLRHLGLDWKIILYTFTTQPRQGEE